MRTLFNENQPTCRLRLLFINLIRSLQVATRFTGKAIDLLIGFLFTFGALGAPVALTKRAHQFKFSMAMKANKLVNRHIIPLLGAD